MPVGRFIVIAIVSLSLWGQVRADQSAGSTSGRRPLPHPDILQVPANSTDNASVVPANAGNAAPVQDTGASAPSIASTSSTASDSTGASKQDKEIFRRADRKASPAGATQAGGVLGRNTSRFSAISELWPLLAVLAVIGVAALAVKKFMPSRKFAVGSDVLRIVARTSVGPKQQLMLIKLGRKLLVVGVSPERINALTTIDDADQVAMLLGDAASSRPDSMTRAFATSIDHESQAYGTDEPESIDEDVTETTRGEVQGLLHKVRQMAAKGQ